MYIENKKIYIYHKQTLSPYAIANKEHLVPVSKTLGPTINAVNKMLASGEEQQVLMGELLGLSSNSPNWDSRLSYYWNSIAEEIESSGRVLEVGYSYDISASKNQHYIEQFNKLASDNAKFKTSEDIYNYFVNSYKSIIDEFDKAIIQSRRVSSVKDSDRYVNEAYRIKYDKIITLESQKYKYGNPVNVSDYMLYRFCLVHSQVANEFSLVDKSQNIRFYLHSEDEIKQYKETKIKLEKDRMSMFLDVVKSSDKVENLLYALGLGVNIKDSDAADRNIMLNTFSSDNPSKFISMASDKNLELRGMIEKYITFNILKRIDGSSIIIDSVDAAKTIGNNIDEAISFFMTDTNKAYLSELSARFKGLPKN
jgi:hypothetical protein